MDSAIERTYQGILNGELIGIFGDYDVDGATSTALLQRYFLLINHHADLNLIPIVKLKIKLCL